MDKPGKIKMGYFATVPILLKHLKHIIKKYIFDHRTKYIFTYNIIIWIQNIYDVDLKPIGSFQTIPETKGSNLKI